MSNLQLSQVMPASQIPTVMNESMPCDQCIHRNCEKQKIACWDFYSYTNNGVVLNKDRNPSASIFQKTMND